MAGEAKARSEIPEEIFKALEADGVLTKSLTGPEYSDEDIRLLGIVHVLLLAELPAKEVRQYLLLEKQPGQNSQQIVILKKYRRELLNHIHEKQKLLDQLDYMIWQIGQEK